tara:strand:+ start:2227 stop:8208 length:5982 start_codon:yes stop_codon:yes gene_type:complete
MAEVKNLFIKSKMNQDLDDRLVPSGEYRQAQNVQISRSEGADVGALENALGNEIVNEAVIQIQEESGLSSPDNLDVIGFKIDENNDRIFLFVTNYIDNSQTNLQHPQLNNNASYSEIYNAITCFNVMTRQLNILTTGRYLNFSKNSLVLGINVLENLLFWTDNRNQPRKINIDRALGDPLYYTTEDQISVAKYYPYSPPRLWAIENCSGQDVPQPQMKNKSIDANPVNYGQDKYNAVTGLPTNPNPTYDPEFAGDGSFLEDKFVRFSYRFKYEDDEMSLMAPFTQTCFIPKQDGYFILNLPKTYNGVGDGINSVQEDNAYKSTIVDFMENKVDSINIYIDLPCPANQLRFKYKVVSLEILYKESNSIPVNIVKKIKITDPIFNSTESFINWEYESAKPIKVLPENETTRVFDRVPIRALSQEVVGNRLVYGNFITSSPYPSSLDYKVGVSEKLNTNVNPPTITSQKVSSRVAYPNHTLKQNRNYQVGVVLADRFGRQTPVILSPTTLEEEIINGITFKNSTIYHKYREKGGEEILYWVGDSIKMLFNSPVQLFDPTIVNNGIYDEVLNPLGWYSYKIVVKQTETDYYNVYTPGMLDGYLEYTSDSVINTIAHTVLINDNINKVPRDLREVGPTQKTFGSSVRLFGRVNNIATKYQAQPAVEPYSTLTLNQPYNAQYYPGQSPDSVVTIGTLADMGMGQTKTVILSHQSNNATVQNENQNVFVKQYSTNIFDNATVLVTSGNTNTIPVGALVKNYRQNPDFISDGTGAGTEGMEAMFNIESEEYPFDIADSAALTFTNATFYNAASNPLILRMSTKESVGSYVTAGPDRSLIVLPELSVLETAPVESNLDIFWETSTTGLISDLNEEASQPFGPRDIGPEWRFIGDEGDKPGFQGDDLLADDFYAIDQLGSQVAGIIDFNNSTAQIPDNSGGFVDLFFGTGAGDFFMPVVYGTSPFPYYNLKLNPNFTGLPNITGAYWTFLQDYAQAPFKGAISFVFNFIPDDASLNPVFLAEQGQVANVAPYYGDVNPTTGDPEGIPLFPDVPSFQAYDFTEILKTFNGSSNTTTNTDQLICSLTSQVEILDPFNQVTAPNGGPLFELVQNTSNSGAAIQGQYKLKLNAGGSPGTYTLVFSVTDANGFGATTTATSSINLLQPGLEGNINNAGIQYGIWSGHVGLFSTNKAGVNNNDVANGAPMWKLPDMLAPIPSMIIEIDNLENKTVGATSPTTSYSRYPLGSWPKQVWDESFSSSGDNQFGLVADYVATYSGTQSSDDYADMASYVWPEYANSRLSCYWQGAPDCVDDPYADSNGFDFGSNSLGSSRSTGVVSPWNRYVPVGVQNYSNSYNKNMVVPNATGKPDYDGNTTFGQGPCYYHSSSNNNAFSENFNQASAVMGALFGWGWKADTSGDNWEDGGGLGDDSGNTFTLPRSGRGSSAVVGSNGRKCKKWDKIVGNSQGAKINTKLSWNNGWGTDDFGTATSSTWATKGLPSQVKFRNRINVQCGGDGGLADGTAIIRIVIDHWNFDKNSDFANQNGRTIAVGANTNCVQEGVMFGNFLIQYRPNSSSAWETATDINDQPLQSGIWDTLSDEANFYGYGACLFYRGSFNNTQVRNGTTTIPYNTKSNGSDAKPGNNYGLSCPATYKEADGQGMVKDKGNGKFYFSEYWPLYVKTDDGGDFPNGLALRNYNNASPGNNQAYAEVCFAVNKVGDYRFIFDNLRQGLKPSAAANSTAGPSYDGARPYIVTTTRPGAGGSVGSHYRSIGPGVCVQVHDMYNERPDNRIWGKNSPAPTFIKKGSYSGIAQQNNWRFPKNAATASYVWYAYTVAINEQSNRLTAVDFVNDIWDPANNNYQYLFAKEPVFRYVSNFYTRVKAGNDYIYSKFTGGSQNGWFAFTKRYVSFGDNTIPDTSAVGPNGEFQFPEDAGVPYGDEKAMGPRRSNDSGVGGVYHTWAVEIEGNTGNFLTRPIPTSYLDIYTTQPAWYNATDNSDWTSGPNVQ